MKAKSMILIMIALGCGLVASIGVSQVISQGGKDVDKQVEKRAVLVAVDLISIANAITEENVRIQEYPIDLIPEGAVESLEQTKNPKQLYAKMQIAKDNIITLGMLGTEKEVGNVNIPSGMRVIAIKASIDELVESLLQPGDRVDITGFFRVDGQQMAITFLNDVQIFSVNQQTDRIIDPDGNAKNAKTVSLLVKPDQVEKLIFAKRSGSLTLSLRNIGDVAASNTTGVRMEDFLTSGNEQPDKRKPVEPKDKDNSAGGITNWLAQTTGMTAPLMPAKVEPVKMLVYSPTGVKEYTWHDPNGVPEVNDISGGSVAVVAPTSFAAPPTTGTGDAKQNTNPPTNEPQGNEPTQDDE